MSWFHVGDETTTGPRYATEGYKDAKGRYCVHTLKEEAGGVVSKTHSIFRCTSCKALAVCAEGERPEGDCMKCGARG